jgi:magnesium transporter
MLTVYDANGTGLSARAGTVPCTGETIWIDLLNPTDEEDAFVEKQLGIAIPTRAEMREIEASSRFYEENGVHFMTASIIYNAGKTPPDAAALTFILAGNRLVTVRYAEPQSFPIFLQRVEKGEVIARTGAAVLVGLLETMIDRAADYIERLQDEVERLAAQIFDLKGGQQTRARRLDVLLKGIGREGDLTSRAREAAFSLERLLTFFTSAARARNEEPRVLEHIDTAKRDIASLLEHARFLSDRITFLLNATLGMINIEQNGIIKIFSVASVALMPPTLIASIYGMNFKHIPELAEPWGYPLALVAMVVSAIAPFFYFRRKGWF